jgi:hypothetical protein
LPGRGRDGDGLRPHGVPFLEAQRPVVHAGGQAEAVFGQRRLAAEVAAIHAADLRDGDVALVDEDEALSGMYSNRVGGGSPGARRSGSANSSRCRRRAGGLEHFEVEARALLEPLRLQQAAGL